MKITEFFSDGVFVSSPRKTDGNYKVQFETGEYSQMALTKLFAVPPKLPENTAMRVTVELYNTKTNRLVDEAIIAVDDDTVVSVDSSEHDKTVATRVTSNGDGTFTLEEIEVEDNF